jgi:putative nucleotidyltransferase with HDIG domain
MQIRDRPQATVWAGFALTVAFTIVLVPLIVVDLYRPALDADGRAPLTIRLPAADVYRDTLIGAQFERRRLVIPRGDHPDPTERRLLAAYNRERRPPGIGLLVGLTLACLVIGLLFTAFLRRFGYRGAQLRTQVALMVALIGFALVGRVFLLFTPLPAFLLPLGAMSIALARRHDREVAFAFTSAAALIAGLLEPLDLGVSFVLLSQGFGAVLGATGRGRKPALAIAGVSSGLLAATAYLVLCFLLQGRLPTEDATSPWTSGWLACLVGGLLSALAAPVTGSLIERGLGHVPRSKLLELTDLNHPMLKKIAETAPGTWAHSLAMANMAELAATAIGADALLTRIGAYFHDLGKSMQPHYYIENLKPGEPSPHDQLDPDVSADAIFSHCTEGVRLGRDAHIPEPVLDFMHMHHGNGLLEYFWHKNQEQGNPKNLSEKDFRYPGLPPQTRETAILAICDAVEAASRTLRDPEERELVNLVQRIVFGKLRLGQLDQSGLTSSDLKLICNSLVDTLKNSLHVRIEYPWQKEEREAQRVAANAHHSSANMSYRPIEMSQKMILDGLDSADAPRPLREGALEDHGSPVKQV